MYTKTEQGRSRYYLATPAEIISAAAEVLLSRGLVAESERLTGMALILETERTEESGEAK